MSRTIGNTTTYASYDYRGNMTQGMDGSTYTYDAQNRLTQATRNGVTMSFAYDGLNRQVRRVVTGGPNPGSFYSVWDGWDLIEEYQRINGNWTVTSAYVYGASGLIAATYNGQVYFHFQDASGSTSHLTDANGVLREWYRYDLQGAPMFYDANNNQLSASAFGVRHLFTGQQWYPELGLYDLRNRFYSPDLGRFLQPDPVGFSGDATNLYRYCGNNAVTRSDPNGEAMQNLKAEGGDYTRGDALDYGYWGGDGTATISFGPLGAPTFDWTGEEL
ncbi:MAG: RHS repeat-associated core domain-containing protein, partial [Chthoniobacterales bacterium]|nr:RHS repeat-associated core domain-containing protein [Chthoniobacterales bacterium]